MFISNVEKVSDYFVCGKIIGDYVLEHGIPLLSRKGNKYYFKKTKVLKEVIDDMPFYLKIFIKRGVVR